MKVLFVSPRQCWPTTGGAKLRDYHFARALGEQGPLTYLFFEDPAGRPMRRQDLPFCEEVIGVPLPPLYSADRVIRGIVGRWPLPVINYTSDQMKQEIARHLGKQDYSLVHLDGVNLAAYLPFIRKLAPQMPVMVDWHNIESEAMRRYSALTPSIARRIYAGVTAPRLAAVERQLLQTASGNLVCSERERVELAKLVPSAKLDVAVNGVDTEAFSVGGAVPSERRNRILFVGLMAYHANVDGAVWFVREVWPSVREQFPDKILTIVGANPSPEVLALATEPRVEVTGTVPDVKPYYDEAFAAIVPLRVGGGTRLKILEAMAAGVPVISTAVGAEGLDVQSGKNILLAETAEEWATCLNMLGDSSKTQALRSEAHALVRSKYDWGVIRSFVTDVYGRWLRES